MTDKFKNINMVKWEIKVFVDYREKYIKEYFEKNKEYDNLVITKNLEIGDIVIEINDKPIILIERKTMKDLASSITDGRLREQKFRIASSTIPKNKIIYLIEGDLDEKIYGHVDKKTLQGSLINIMIRDDYKVYRTRDPKESVYFLVRLITKLLKEKEKLVPDIVDDITQIKNDYCDTIILSKKGNMTPETFNQVVFLQIPGVSNRFIKEIQKEYPSIKDLILKYESIEEVEKREDLITNIQIELNNGKKRRIGFIISKRIYDFLYL
jgi:ERCC4-type nuclease